MQFEVESYLWRHEYKLGNGNYSSSVRIMGMILLQWFRTSSNVVFRWFWEKQKFHFICTLKTSCYLWCNTLLRLAHMIQFLLKFKKLLTRINISISWNNGRETTGSGNRIVWTRGVNQPLNLSVSPSGCVYYICKASYYSWDQARLRGISIW